MEGPPHIRRYEMASRAALARLSTEAYRSQVNPHIKEYTGRLAAASLRPIPPIPVSPQEEAPSV